MSAPDILMTAVAIGVFAWPAYRLFQLCRGKS